METIEEYFGQGEYYHSESARELIRIDSMIPQYALNAWNKLYSTHGREFLGTVLSHALTDHFMPASASLSDVLRQHGKASVFTGEGLVSVNAARKRLRRAGAIATHRKGDWVEGTMQRPQVAVRRKKERVNA